MHKILLKFLSFLFLLLFWGARAEAQSFVMSNCAQHNWVLAVPCGNYVNNQQMIIWKFSDSLGDQKFLLIKRQDGTVTIAPASSPNMAIGIPNCVLEQNKPLILWESNNNLDQKWIFEHINGSIYIIRSCVNRDYVLAPLTGELDARIVVQRYTGADHQKWAIMMTNETLYEIFKSVYSE